MPLHSIGDHPVIRNMEQTGYPDGKEPEAYRCPVCGEVCESIFKNKGYGHIVGCDNCIEGVDPCEVDCL